MRQHTASLLVVSTLAIAASGAHAAIVSVSGQAALIGAPVSALGLALPGPPAFCWDEQTNVVIPATGILVNTLGNGFWTGPTPNLAAYVGAPVDSHMIHFDASTGVANVGGQVVFSGNILAVIYENVLLDATDPLFGAPGTAYDTGNPLRSNSSALFASAYQVNNNVLDFSLWALQPGIPNRMVELRVLTAANVPAPGALALLGLAGAATLRRRR